MATAVDKRDQRRRARGETYETDRRTGFTDRTARTEPSRTDSSEAWYPDRSPAAARRAGGAHLGAHSETQGTKIQIQRKKLYHVSVLSPTCNASRITETHDLSSVPVLLQGRGVIREVEHWPHIHRQQVLNDGHEGEDGDHGHRVLTCSSSCLLHGRVRSPRGCGRTPRYARGRRARARAHCGWHLRRRCRGRDAR